MKYILIMLVIFMFVVNAEQVKPPENVVVTVENSASVTIDNYHTEIYNGIEILVMNGYRIATEEEVEVIRMIESGQLDPNDTDAWYHEVRWIPCCLTAGGITGIILICL
ncbi:MAG: hypothetical protein JXR48_07470 [Candidatus Delongbacteria bacterium]|nr:hypothetical protein [Candidatus Delongbacteria bacterium]MBN2834790.1 hypothetical protein [Candidatus Delongbacteria bacterium]